MPFWPDKPPPHDPKPEPPLTVEPVETTPTLEVLEALARQAIAKAASIQVRGWNGRREKDEAIRLADEALEAYNFARDVTTELDALGDKEA